MTITLNGQPADLEKESPLAEVLVALGFRQSHLAVAVNGEFVARSLYEQTVIVAGDAVEVVAPMQGG